MSITFQRMLLGALVFGAAPLAAQNPAKPKPAEPKTYFCYAYTQMRGTMWVTPLHPLGPDVMALDAAWLKKVKAELFPDVGQHGAKCPFGTEEAMTAHRKTVAPKLYITKVVDVDWSYWKDAETPADADKLNQAAEAGQFVLCYSDPGQSPVYFSADIRIDVPAIDPMSNKNDGGASVRAIDGLKSEYLAYLKKSHGYKTSSAFPVYCQGGRRSAAELALIRETMHQQSPKLKLMETGWLPGTPQIAAPGAAAASAPAPAAAPAPAPVPSPGGPPKPAAPAPLPVDDGHTYAYCYDNGYPPRAPTAPGHTIYYVSDLFPADAGTHPGPAFEKVLHTAHPGEKIGTATCTAPQKLGMTRKTRDSEIAARQKNPYITVAEVHWKP